MQSERKPTDFSAYLASPIQQGMLFNSLREPGSGVDIEQLLFDLPEPLDVAAFRQAWAQVARRHPALRTYLRWKDVSEPQQVVQADIPLPWEEHRWHGIGDEEWEAALERLLDADRRRGFDLASPPLFRLTLLHRGENRFHLLWTLHHVILDGRSFEVLLEELFEIYEGILRNEDNSLPAPKPYSDYIDWLGQRDRGRDESFWRACLQGFTAPTPLLSDNAIPGSGTQQPAGKAIKEALVPASVTQVLREIASKNQFTLNTVVQGCWALLLSRYSGEVDVVFGAVRANRRSTIEGAERMVGLFINTLPFRVKVDPVAPLLPWLRQLRQQWLEMRGHEHASLADIQAWTELPAGTPLFLTTMMYERHDLESLMRKQGGAWLKRRIRTFSQTNYPLDFAVYDGESLRLRIDFDRTRIEAATAERMLGHLQTMLRAIASYPQGQVGNLPLLTQSELDQLSAWNDTGRHYPRESLLHGLFEEQALRSPDSVKLVFGDQHLTNAELDTRANQLAHLLQESGVGPDAVVAICVERSIEMVVGILGILKSGGAYLPLDPDLPAERIGTVLGETQAPVVLTQQRLRPRFDSVKARVISLDAGRATIEAHPVSPPPLRMTPENLAYVIYTSGATGRPKGVMVTHAAICNHMQWVRRVHPLSGDDVELQKTPLGFDASVWELFAPLITDARLAIARPEGHMDPAYLAAAIQRHRVSSLQVVPSQLRMLLDEPSFLECGKCLQRIYCGGEPLARDLQDAVHARFPKIRLYNMYGPTEGTIDSTWWACTPSDCTARPIPIGRPIDNVRAYVVDARMQLLPISVPGELAIGGAGLARGYLSNPEATAECFLPDPFCASTGERIYKTGDRARYLSDGNIEFLGRIDHQVKIRGFRIEPGEIEAILATHPAVRESLVVAHEFSPQDVRLVAYIVTHVTPTDLTEQLREMLKAKMPEYIVPAYFVVLPALPLTLIGKVDRARLPVPQQSTLQPSTYVAPRTPMEKALAALWREVLQLEHVGVRDDFFELGGHSLLLGRLISRINLAHKIRIGVPDFIQNPTIEQLGRWIDGQRRDKPHRSAVISLNEGQSGLPVYFISAGPPEFRVARHAGKAHPVFGIEAQWPMAWRAALSENRAADFPSLQQVVAPYADALYAHVGSAPCALAGFSYSGLLAFEAARQLRQVGGQPELVLLIDSQAEAPKPYQQAWHSLRKDWEESGRATAGQADRWTLASRVESASRLASWMLGKVGSKIAYFFRHREPELETLTGMLDEQGMPLPWGLLDRLYGDIDKTYHPQVLECRGALLRTYEIDGRRIVSPDDTLGWGKVFSRGLEVIPLVGNHYSIFGEQVPTIARELNRILSKLESCPSSSHGTDTERP